jgi:hypothetical protein
VVVPWVVGGSSNTIQNTHGDHAFEPVAVQPQLLVRVSFAGTRLLLYPTNGVGPGVELPGKNPEMGERIAIEGNAVETLFVGARSVVHIHGDLSGSLRVGEHSEVVVGGNIAKEGRIRADGIVAIHVQGSLDGVIECHSMAGVWVGGDLRGQVLTGEPGMFLRVKGNLQGTVRPSDRAALLAIDVEGNAASSVVKVIDAYNYTELNMSAARSDLSAGIHRLWSGRPGFVAVTAAQ